jgi:hypothetical protein
MRLGIEAAAEGVRRPILGCGSRGLSRVGCRLKIHIAGERYRISKGQDLRGPIAAQPVFAVYPIERVGEPGPAEGPCRPPGRRLLVVDHEGVRPRFLQTGEKLGIVRQARDDAGQHHDLLVRLQAVAYRRLDRFRLENPALRARPVVEPHAYELHVFAD